MIRMVIADDEPIIRDGLQNSFPWHEYGIEIVGTAPDGQAAFHLCRQMRPDILFTDIRMPLMDGLELIQQVREESPDIKFIIISGMQDFAYAKTAIELNVEGYVLKPVKLPELREIVQRTVKNIELERSRESTIQRFRENLIADMPLLREHFLRQLLFSSTLDKQTAPEKFRYFSLPFSAADKCQVCVLQIDNYAETLSRLFNDDHLLLNYGVLNIINELVAANCKGIAFLNTDNEYVLILGRSEGPVDAIEALMAHVLSSLTQYFKIQVSVGIGGESPDALTLLRSYQEAKTALEQRFFMGDQSVVYYRDVADIYGYQPESPVDTEKLNRLYGDLVHNLKTGNVPGAEGTIGGMFTVLRQSPTLDSQYTYAYSTELICNISRWVNEFGEHIESGGRGDTLTVLKEMQQCKTAMELEHCVNDVCIGIARAFQKRRQGKAEGVVATIRQIAETRYQEPLSIPLVAESVYLTPNYVSAVFKQETGKTFGEYLASVRMEKAKELLREPDIKVQDVAQLVGFENAAYFSTVFKKQIGMTPQEYRTMRDVKQGE